MSNSYEVDHVAYEVYAVPSGHSNTSASPHPQSSSLPASTKSQSSSSLPVFPRPTLNARQDRLQGRLKSLAADDIKGVKAFGATTKLVHRRKLGRGHNYFAKDDFHLKDILNRDAGGNPKRRRIENSTSAGQTNGLRPHSPQFGRDENLMNEEDFDDFGDFDGFESEPENLSLVRTISPRSGKMKTRVVDAKQSRDYILDPFEAQEFDQNQIEQQRNEPIPNWLVQHLKSQPKNSSSPAQNSGLNPAQRSSSPFGHNSRVGRLNLLPTTRPIPARIDLHQNSPEKQFEQTPTSRLQKFGYRAQPASAHFPPSHSNEFAQHHRSRQSFIRSPQPRFEFYQGAQPYSNSPQFMQPAVTSPPARVRQHFTALNPPASQQALNENRANHQPQRNQPASIYPPYSSNSYIPTSYPLQAQQDNSYQRSQSFYETQLNNFQYPRPPFQQPVNIFPNTAEYAPQPVPYYPVYSQPAPLWTTPSYVMPALAHQWTTLPEANPAENPSSQFPPRQPLQTTTQQFVPIQAANTTGPNTFQVQQPNSAESAANEIDATKQFWKRDANNGNGQTSKNDARPSQNRRETDFPNGDTRRTDSAQRNTLPATDSTADLEGIILLDSDSLEREAFDLPARQEAKIFKVLTDAAVQTEQSKTGQPPKRKFGQWKKEQEAEQKEIEDGVDNHPQSKRVNGGKRIAAPRPSIDSALQRSPSPVPIPVKIQPTRKSVKVNVPASSRPIRAEIESSEKEEENFVKGNGKISHFVRAIRFKNGIISSLSTSANHTNKDETAQQDSFDQLEISNPGASDDSDPIEDDFSQEIEKREKGDPRKGSAESFECIQDDWSKSKDISASAAQIPAKTNLPPSQSQQNLIQDKSNSPIAAARIELPATSHTLSQSSRLPKSASQDLNESPSQILNATEAENGKRKFDESGNFLETICSNPQVAASASPTHENNDSAVAVRRTKFADRVKARLGEVLSQELGSPASLQDENLSVSNENENKSKIREITEDEENETVQENSQSASAPSSAAPASQTNSLSPEKEENLWGEDFPEEFFDDLGLTPPPVAQAQPSSNTQRRVVSAIPGAPSPSRYLKRVQFNLTASQLSNEAKFPNGKPLSRKEIKQITSQQMTQQPATNRPGTPRPLTRTRSLRQIVQSDSEESAEENEIEVKLSDGDNIFPPSPSLAQQEQEAENVSESDTIETLEEEVDELAGGASQESEIF